MNSDISAPASVAPIPQPVLEGDLNVQVRLKSEGGRLLLLLPPETETGSAPNAWSDVWQQLKQRLNAGERFWQPNTSVHLLGRDRLLDARQIQSIADALSEVELQLKRVYTSRRQTAVAAVTLGYSVEQQSPVARMNPPVESGKPLDEPLYVQTTVRSGVDIRHAGTVIVLGDVNPGGTVIADGDVLVWGNLRGTVHAGAAGNARCLVMALRLEPTQIRIADFMARSPEHPPAEYSPEVAYVAPEGIRITRAEDYARLRIRAEEYSNPQ